MDVNKQKECDQFESNKKGYCIQGNKKGYHVRCNKFHPCWCPYAWKWSDEKQWANEH